MLKKLRFKFVLIIMTIVTIMIVAILGLLYYSTAQKLDSESMKMLDRLTIDPMLSFPREEMWTEMGMAQEEFLPENMPMEKGEDMHLPYFTVIVSDAGEVSNMPGSFIDTDKYENFDEVIKKLHKDGLESGTIKEYDLRYTSTRMPFGTFYVFVDITNEHLILKNLLVNSILVSIIAFLVFLGISILFSYWAVKPVENAWKQQKKFVADASHELKTPLTVIMTDAALLNNEDCSERDRKNLSDSILSMSTQMRGLVESMLELARLDSGSVAKKKEQIDFSEIADNASMIFEPIFFEKGMLFEYEIQKGITVNGDVSQLKQLIDILLDNAAKYASEGGKTILKIEGVSHNHCILSVSNEGEPIPKEEMNNLFKRFYRADKARKMDHSYGLGLSIAQSIVEKHHGRIWGESKEGYNTFYVELPCIRG